MSVFTHFFAKNGGKSFYVFNLKVAIALVFILYDGS